MQFAVYAAMNQSAHYTYYNINSLYNKNEELHLEAPHFIFTSIRLKYLVVAWLQM